MNLSEDPEVRALIAAAVQAERHSCARIARQEANHQSAVGNRLRERGGMNVAGLATNHFRTAAVAERIARAIEASGDFNTKYRILDMRRAGSRRSSARA